MNNLIAFIPARAGSKRIPNKAVKPLGGKPLIVYTIKVAKRCKIFDAVYVSSDSNEIGDIAKEYGVNFIKRPPEFARDDSPDAEWIEHAISIVNDRFYFYCILRPTNPFRTVSMINRAWREWNHVSTMKAVERVKQHPGKMWRIANDNMIPYFGHSFHLLPTQTLDRVYVQNGSLEFRSILNNNNEYQPFFTRKIEGFDINDEFDWIIAERIISEKDTFQDDRKQRYGEVQKEDLLDKRT